MTTSRQRSSGAFASHAGLPTQADREWSDERPRRIFRDADGTRHPPLPRTARLGVAGACRADGDAESPEARLQPGNVLLSGDGMSLVEFRLELGLPICAGRRGTVTSSRAAS
jgi:hypothetical protein